MYHGLWLQTTMGESTVSLGSILIPLVLGFLAVFLLLPRPQPFPPLWGAAAGGLAILSGGWFLVRGGVMDVGTVLFYVFSAIAIAGGGLLLAQRNPVHAALSFAVVVLSTCGLFLLQAAPFLMAATIIIYAGAIIVTFLFLIMLAQQSGISNADLRSREPLLASVAGFVLLGALLLVLKQSYDTGKLDDLLARVDRARTQNSLEGIRGVLGDGNELFEDFYRESARSHVSAERSRALNEALTNVQLSWLAATQTKQDDDLTKVKNALASLHDRGVGLRDRYGNLDPPAGIRLSTHSQPDFRQPGASLPSNESRLGQMPAENVAALGRSLFTDFLIPVELGGTLLLAATIGTIAIAGRRTEVLR